MAQLQDYIVFLHHGSRVNVECRDSRLQMIGRSQFLQLLQQVAMPSVNAVEEAYGNSISVLHNNVQN